ncbi:IclR family transcriptional regulator [Pseudomonas sp. NPDC089530]|uniref:IclR family transcriptional regulator n=1 Tax=Pseudomonas sp. NPDC089530 TaxID=3390651 RepID=UPI003D00E95B
MGEIHVVGSEGREQSPTSQTLDRAMQLVRLISTARHAGLALSELVRAGGMTKPTTRRLLISLIGNGLVVQDPQSRRYFLGLDIYMLGVIAAERYGIQSLASESLLNIAAASCDAALLCVQRDMEWVCLAREEGTYPLRSHVLQPGARHPLGAGAAGMALLAAMSDDDVEAVLAKNGRQLTEHYPGHSVEAVRRQLVETRRNGYSLNAGYVFSGSWGMAVALRDERSGLCAALTIAGVEGRFSGDRVNELAQLLYREKAKLEQLLKRSGSLSHIA